MENEIVAHHAGAVDEVGVAVGDQVTSGQALVRLV
jgi:biotin carboxyl carrier protein